MLASKVLAPDHNNLLVTDTEKGILCAWGREWMEPGRWREGGDVEDVLRDVTIVLTLSAGRWDSYNRKAKITNS